MADGSSRRFPAPRRATIIPGAYVIWNDKHVVLVPKEYHSWIFRLLVKPAFWCATLLLRKTALSWNACRNPDIRPDLMGAYLWFARLSGMDLSAADLVNAGLVFADLTGANLSAANLQGANLGCANLSDANLSAANLSGANLSGANLTGANLSAANLIRADLDFADLTGANLSDANQMLGLTIPPGILAIADEVIQ
jgi:Pentapeptide repeats (8 copies)